MSDLFVLRDFDPPIGGPEIEQMGAESAGCFALHRVEWRQSCLSSNGRRLVCWLSAPDAESARIALRQAGADLSDAWPGSVHDAPGPGAPSPESANVLVERRFAQPVALDALQAVEDAGAWCLEVHRVRFVRTFFSSDRQRMLCLYAAPDAESVRLAQRQAGMPVDAVWAFQRFGP